MDEYEFSYYSSLFQEKKARDCLAVDKYNVEASETLANIAQVMGLVYLFEAPCLEYVCLHSFFMCLFPIISTMQNNSQGK